MSATKPAVISVAAAMVVALPALAMIEQRFDTRYAMAEDFKQLQEIFVDTAIDDYEEKVEELEESITNQLTRVRQSGGVLETNGRIEQLKNRKAKYLRKLDRLNGK